MKEYESYQVYKGLQRPLIFKGLKGQYIYYAFATAGASLVLTVICIPFGGYIGAGCVMLGSAFGGIIALALYQKKYGLYNKKRINKTFILKGIFNRD